MRNRLFLIAALAFGVLTSPTIAAELGANENAKAKGSLVGVYSSQVTGNGAAIGGGTNGGGQTSEPGSRAEEVQSILASEGRGRDK